MSDERHPHCVRVVEEMTAARQLAEWLTEKGFPASVEMPELVATPGDSLGITPESFTGYEVRVAMTEHAEPARQALEDLKEEVAARMEKVKKRSERTGTATAVCEECGKSSDWPATSMGTTETCPHCAAYMDVPDPEENWDDVDFGAEDTDNENEASNTKSDD
jgi:hypothetical protein